jgi:hypothetical protein
MHRTVQSLLQVLGRGVGPAGKGMKVFEALKLEIGTLGSDVADLINN